MVRVFSPLLQYLPHLQDSSLPHNLCKHLFNKVSLYQVKKKIILEEADLSSELLCGKNTTRFRLNRLLNKWLLTDSIIVSQDCLGAGFRDKSSLSLPQVLRV